jgi:DNA-binding IclR family transcriptional regulator
MKNFVESNISGHPFRRIDCPQAEAELVEGDPEGQNWSLLSSHGMVLFMLALRPESTLRELAQQVRLTERTVHSIVQDLAAADMVRTTKRGRRNSYVVNPDAHAVHPLFAHLKVGAFLRALSAQAG